MKDMSEQNNSQMFSSPLSLGEGMGVRQDFPILSRTVYGKPLVYLDNGATTQKPRCVVDAITDEYYSVNANVHRGVHFLSQQATELHEASRETVRRFINARSSTEIVFTRGTTESINLLASSFGEAFLKEGDEVIVSTMEHHSNIVPWQLLQMRKGIVLRVIPMNDRGELLLDEYERLFTPRTRIVCVAHVSNVLGTVNPVREMIATAHAHGVPVLVDGAQSIPHMPVDVQALDADFYVFSGHKVYGPTGVGVLYGKEDWLDKLPPYQGGGEMIQHVSFERTTFNELPFKFEAGTPDYIGTTGLAKALDYVSALGMERIAAYEHELTEYATRRLKEIPGMRIFGEAPEKGSVISFLVGNIHHFDMGTLLDRLGIAVRTGHHCAQPLMQRLGIEGTVRASFALYNTKEEIDALVAGVERVSRMF
jgi:cysteine desulfurase/selenocysteine lyase